MKLQNLASIIVVISLTLFSSEGTASSETGVDSKQPLPLEELRSFSEVFYYVKSTYVDEIEDKALIDAAIRGMVDSLDNHSRYLDPSAFANFTADNEGEYAGIGLSFNDHENGIQISSIVPAGPADRAKLQVGMVVSKINNIDIKQISTEDAYKLLYGKVNTQLKLSVLDHSETKSSAFKDYLLTREIIQLPSIVSERLPGNVGYVAISQFTKKSPVEFIQAVNKTSPQAPISKLIIDLRNNPGGVLEAAVEISDLFIDSGILLTSSGRTQDANEVFQASSIAPYLNFDVVVMMNQNSASSSEILAAALQDHQKATILGDISYGKGSIQSIIFLRRETGLKLTTAKYYSPKGNKIQDVGIKPDVMFKTAGLENNQGSEKLNDLELLQAYQLVSAKDKK
jgi:carboxyl-terminal processing protease